MSLGRIVLICSLPFLTSIGIVVLGLVRARYARGNRIARELERTLKHGR